MEIHWSSDQYSKFLLELDNNMLNYTSEMKDKNKSKRSLQYERTYDGNKLDYELKPCEGLPVNFYSSTFLKRLTWTEKLILYMKKKKIDQKGYPELQKPNTGLIEFVFNCT